MTAAAVTAAAAALVGAARVPVDPRHGAVEAQPRAQVPRQVARQVRQGPVQDEVRIPCAAGADLRPYISA